MLFDLRHKRDRRGIRTQHIHMITRRRGFQEHWGRMLFRDYLVAHPEIAREYGRLKVRLAAIHQHDRLAYTCGKAAFISRIMARLGNTEL